ncbi:hypothetical protein CU097_006407, partial [Rhizopus azygosporus]
SMLPFLLPLLVFKNPSTLLKSNVLTLLLVVSTLVSTSVVVKSSLKNKSLVLLLSTSRPTCPLTNLSVSTLIFVPPPLVKPSLKLSLITGNSCPVTHWKPVTRSTTLSVMSVPERVLLLIFLVLTSTMTSF